MINSQNNKRYELGVLDLYPIAVIGTSIEDSPTVGVTLDEPVDGDRLFNALLKTVDLFPLFKTRIVFDKGYYLEENDKPILIFNDNDYDRTFTWKSGTNDYPWKLSYYNDRILFRWCHAITDGRGAELFFKVLINNYYNIDLEIEPHLELGLEPFADKKEKGIPQKKQAGGFGIKEFGSSKQNRQTKCHVLKCKTSDVIALSKRSDASPATVIPPLFSIALRECMRQKRNVSFSIVIDARIPLNHNTMHNCILPKNITYIDKFDDMDFELVSTIYRALLNLAYERENIIVEATNNVNSIGLIVKRKCEFLVKLGGRLCAKFMKNTSSDVTFTYLGKIDFGEGVNKHLKDYTFVSWTDFGYCNIGATDLNGVFTMYISESYDNENIIPKFISVAKKHGLEISVENEYNYYRADI